MQIAFNFPKSSAEAHTNWTRGANKIHGEIKRIVHWLSVYRIIVERDAVHCCQSAAVSTYVYMVVVFDCIMLYYIFARSFI